MIMNKARRNEIKQLKYKKRLQRLGMWNADTAANPKGAHQSSNYNFIGYKNSSNPCSCPVCSNRKYNRAKINKYEDLRSGIKAVAGMQAMSL